MAHSSWARMAGAAAGWQRRFRWRARAAGGGAYRAVVGDAHAPVLHILHVPRLDASTFFSHCYPAYKGGRFTVNAERCPRALKKYFFLFLRDKEQAHSFLLFHCRPCTRCCRQQ